MSSKIENDDTAVVPFRLKQPTKPKAYSVIKELKAGRFEFRADPFVHRNNQRFGLDERHVQRCPIIPRQALTAGLRTAVPNTVAARNISS